MVSFHAKYLKLRHTKFSSFNLQFQINPRPIISDLTYRQRFSLQGAKTAKEPNFFFWNRFSAITFDSNLARTFFYQQRVPLVQTRRMNYYLTLKGHVENFDLRSRSWPDPKRSCCISFDLHRRPEHTYGVFIALAGVYLKWHWRHGKGSQVAIFRLMVSSLPVTRCLNVSNGFLPKEPPFNFLPLTYNGEVAKLTWPWVMNIEIPRYTFYTYC